MKIDQESVWDYPRPPRLEPFDGTVEILHTDRLLANSQSVYRVLETSHPPTYYIPPTDIEMDRLVRVAGSSFCEWKGQAHYFALSEGGSAPVAWAYQRPTEPFHAIADYLCFYASRLDVCKVNGEIVQPQEGDFYGGWITSNIVGPFKGAPGTRGW